MKSSRKSLWSALLLLSPFGSALALAQTTTAPAAPSASNATTQVAPAIGDTAPTDPSTPAAGKRGSKRLQTMETKRLETLDTALKLTDDEKSQIKAIWSKTAADIKAGGDRRALMKASHDQVRTVLTPEQQAKFDAMPPEARGNRAKKDSQ